MLCDQQAGRHECDADARGFESLAKCPQISVQQRFAAGQHHPLHMKAANPVHVPVEIVRRDFALIGVGLPDIAHHATAIAGAVHRQRQDRQALEPAGHQAAGASREFAGPDHLMHLEAGLAQRHLR